MEPLHYFSSLEELSKWIYSNKTNAQLLDIYPPPTCTESARTLITNAEMSGYRLDFEVLTKIEYDKYYLGSTPIVKKPINSEGFVGTWPELELGGGHAVGSSLIDNKLYLIEPLTDDIWLYGGLEQ